MKISMLEGMGQITQGEPKKLKAPKPENRMVENAHDSKVRATAAWVDGRITSKEHGEVHKRADKIIQCKGKM